MKKPKPVEEYNSRDVLEIFYTLYSQKYKKRYPRKYFILQDLAKIKQAIEMYGLFVVLGSFYRLLDTGDAGVNIPYWFKGLEFGRYQPAADPQLYFYMRTKNDPIISKLWQEWAGLDGKWFPTPESTSRKIELERELRLLI